MYKRLFSLIIIFFIGTNRAYTQESHWMPDPVLREVVREKLGIPADNPFTQGHVQLYLTGLVARGKGIVDLTGLEHATHLFFLDLGGNQISDISPLSGLVNLEVLRLGGNQIKDVSPLAGLVNLRELVLSVNPISDISPLVGLENLKDLRIQHTNTKGVLSTIPISKLKQFGYDESCDLEGIPISERIENRNYPSIYGGFGGGRLLNLPELEWREGLAYHDLHWSSLLFHMQWLPSPEGLKTFVHVESAKEERDDLLSRNPNMLFIVAMNYQAANPGEYPEDWPYWLRDESGDIIEDVGWGGLLIDFTHPEIQDLEVERAIAFAKCGLFDGIMLDWWRDEWNYRKDAHYYASDVHEAAITLLRRIREAVGDDFLIIVNANETKIPRSAPYVNGMYMETISSPLHGYTHQELIEIESTLLWGEQYLREPRVNCLRGKGLPSEPSESPRNQQWMRLFTTMSLTHSDGYVLYTPGISFNTHTHEYEIWDGHSEVHERGELHAHTEHYWYPFYEVPLGSPVGAKGQLYEAIEGLFIREFTNGWAVYNRSGKEQQIEFPEAVSGVASGVEEKRSHTLPDLDGEIYLKVSVSVPADINADGIVNILDIVLVANAFGDQEPDLNGDGTVNILDLVIVANAFGNP